MPIIQVSIPDLERLTGIHLTQQRLENLMEVMKAEIEEIKWNEGLLILEASHDRPDLFSAEGLARSIAYFAGVREPRKYEKINSGIALDVSHPPSYRPYAFLAVVRNVELDEEAIKQLVQLQEKLHLTYGRDRELVSIGFYDLKKVKPPLRYIAVKEMKYIPLGYEEAMTFSEVLEKTEKGRAYAHLVRKGEYPALIDSTGKVLSFPPVLNGEDTKVTESTTDLVIDVTGVEPHLMMKVLNVVSTSIAERSENHSVEIVKLTGCSDAGYTYSPQLEGKIININHRTIENILGFNVSKTQALTVLKKHGYLVEEEELGLKVWVPPYRIDVLTEEDIVEDVAIGIGYNTIQTEVLPPSHGGVVSGIERMSNALRMLVSGMGIQEVVNFMLVDPEVLNLVTDSAFVEVENPKMKTFSAVRNTLIASLLLTAQANQERVGNMEVFEVGDVVLVENQRARTARMLGILLMGDYTLTEGIATFKAISEVLGMKVSFKPMFSKPFIKGRCASIEVGKEKLGIVGEIDPSVLVKLGIKKPVVTGELSVDSIRRLLLR